MRTIILCVVLFIAGCGGPKVAVRYEARRALLAQRRYAIEPVRFESMRVGRVAAAQWIARKSEAQRQRWAADQRLLSDTFAAHVAARVPIADGAGALIIRPIVDELEPGYYAYVASGRTHMVLRVQIIEPLSNQVVEELELRDAVNAHAWSAAAGPRMARAAANLGDRLGDFLRARSR
ncbi:MAG: uncharacterized protein JWN44_686 [Myxococcales bacterium]|nr:uncharacterized protein [Myxococcales bacterium]